MPELSAQSRWQPGIAGGYEIGHSVKERGYSIALRTEYRTSLKRLNSLRLEVGYIQLLINRDMNDCVVTTRPNYVTLNGTLLTHYYRKQTALILPLQFKYAIIKKPLTIYLFHGVTNWFFNLDKIESDFYQTDTLCNIISDKKINTYQDKENYNGFNLTTGISFEYPLTKNWVLQFEPAGHWPTRLTFSAGCKFLFE